MAAADLEGPEPLRTIDGRRRTSGLIGLASCRLLLPLTCEAESVAQQPAPPVKRAPAGYIGIVSGGSRCVGRTIALQYEIDQLVRTSDVLVDLDAPPAAGRGAPVTVLSTVTAIRAVLRDGDARLLVLGRDGAPLLLVRLPETPRKQLEVLRLGLSILAIKD